MGYVCKCGDLSWQIINAFLMFLFPVKGSKKKGEKEKRKKSLEKLKVKSIAEKKTIIVN